MKKWICMALTVLMVLSLAACGGKQADENFEWTREGYYQDGNGNYLFITPSDNEDLPGWYVGLVADGEMHGWYIQQEGKTLHGDLISDYEGEGELIVTITEEGSDGVKVVVEKGDTYHFTPVDASD